MPLTPIYTWSENESSVRLTINNVPIKDQSQLFCSDRVVKLNAPPYLLLLDLKGTVDDERSTATVLHGRKVVFQLAKAEPGLWGSLTADGDKAAIKQLRDESVARAHQKQVAAQQQRLAQKQKEEKAAINHQIAQERAQRARIEALKQQELQNEREQLQQWQQQQQQGSQLLEAGDESDYEDDLNEACGPDASAAAAAGGGGPASTKATGGSLQDAAMPDHPDYHGRGWKPSSNAATAQQQGQEEDQGAKHSSSSSSKAEAAELITLTANSSRRQHASAMQSLVSDAAAAATGQDPFASEPSSSSSSRTACDVWSSADASHPAAAAGSELLLTAVHTTSSSKTSSADLASAAPTSAAQPAMPAAAPAPPSKPPAPVRCRAGPVAVTFTQLETAHLPAREQREVEIKGIKRHAHDKSDSLGIAERQPAFLKDKGDGLAAQGNYRGAINAYTRALELDPKQAALWSNRAACHLAVGQAAECEQDCNAAIDLVQGMHSRLMEAAGLPGAEHEVLAGLLPAAATADAAAAGAARSSAGGAAAARPGVADDAGGAMQQEKQGQGLGKQQQQQLARAAAAGDAAGRPPAAAEALADDAAGDAAVQKGSGEGSAALRKVVQKLVKVLARRAAARVELQQLAEAALDLQHALRLDPNNAQLMADALEVAAALNPITATDPASLKQRADARFKAGDVQGAAEAYTALIQLLRQQQQEEGEEKEEEVQGSQDGVFSQEAAANGAGQNGSNQDQQQQQQLLLAALSNRAACWLSLESYQQCVEDCSAALALALAGGEGVQLPESHAAAAAVAGTAEGDVSTCPQSPVLQQQQQTVLQLLEQRPPESLLAQAGALRVKSAARLLGRLAVANSCLKELQLAVQLYGWAQRYWRVVGEEQRVAELAADQAHVQQLLEQAG